MTANATAPGGLDREKAAAAEVAAGWVERDMRLGIGTGSTAAYFITRIGRRIAEEGLRVSGLATSEASARLAREHGIPLLTPARGLRLDLTVDGADEIDPSLTLTKGGGGALLRERIVASISSYVLIIADSSKPVATLGRFPLPVEVVPFAAPLVMDRITALGGTPTLRQRSGDTVVTDQANWLLDCAFDRIPDPAALSSQLSAIPGIVAFGLFVNVATAAVIARGGATTVVRRGVPDASAAVFARLPEVARP